ncbi:hypothetical protein ERJ75_000887300 [Trypanosoma vivax]|nr:hypothetical protein ERJ75_000887600 [Trypanosoma vivax]KAH8612467.1 hypothetical protein ERJ75_000887300 [Trypanosoma vivax]
MVRALTSEDQGAETRDQGGEQRRGSGQKGKDARLSCCAAFAFGNCAGKRRGHRGRKHGRGVRAAVHGFSGDGSGSGEREENDRGCTATRRRGRGAAERNTRRGRGETSREGLLTAVARRLDIENATQARLRFSLARACSSPIRCESLAAKLG